MCKSRISNMPREVKEVKEFLILSRRKDAKYVTVKQNPDNVKFKLRCSKCLHTLVLKDKEKAGKFQSSLPKTLSIRYLK
uniref:Large ribosomal subunit protein eL38 n=1 Tax=Panagrolaimus sp. PS1159 TaxID=55785 RepID=A0AC35FSQ9_9BILA